VSGGSTPFLEDRTRSVNQPLCPAWFQKVRYDESETVAANGTSAERLLVGLGTARGPDVQRVIRSEPRDGNCVEYYNCLPDAFKTAHERLPQRRQQSRRNFQETKLEKAEGKR